MDWQTGSTLTSCNRHILEKELHTDVVFRVGETGTLIKAHKLMLANRSAVFERMFYGSLPEKTKRPIVISDIEAEPFKALLRYCYYEDQKVERGIALSTMYAAHKYMVPTLEAACRAILVNSLGSDNIWDVYLAGIRYDDGPLCDACRRFFKQSVKLVQEAFQSYNFLEVPFCVLLDILQINDSNKCMILAPDIVIFKACNAWAQAECLREEIDPSGPNKRTALGDCLYLISFPKMLPKDLVNVVFPTEILNQEEKLSLLEQKHRDPSTKASINSNFLSTNHILLVELWPEACPTWLKQMSPAKQQRIYYSAINISLLSNLLISGIVLDIHRDRQTHTKHEVMISEIKTGIISCKSGISDKSMLLRCKHCKFIYFEEMLLKANFEYQIKIETDLGTVRATAEGKVGNDEKANLIRIVPDQCNIEVTSNVSNDSIMFLLARMV